MFSKLSRSTNGLAHAAKALFGTLVLGAALIAPAAHAGSATGTVATSATLTGDCTISATPIAFGTVSSLAKTVTANGSFSMLCTSGTAYQLGVSVGLSPDANPSAPTRYLSDGAGHELPYTIWSTNSATQLWPLGYGSFTLTPTGSGATLVWPIQVYLQPSATPVVPGNYTDTVTLTLAY